MSKPSISYDAALVAAGIALRRQVTGEHHSGPIEEWQDRCTLSATIIAEIRVFLEKYPFPKGANAATAENHYRQVENENRQLRATVGLLLSAHTRFEYHFANMRDCSIDLGLAREAVQSYIDLIADPDRTEVPPAPSKHGVDGEDIYLRDG